MAGENQPDDQAAAINRFIGRGSPLNSSAPVIDSVTPPQVVGSGSSATITVFNIQDTDGIDRVWAILSPPAFISDSPAVLLHS